MTVPLFVDTNALIYDYDTGAAERHAVAKALVGDLWRLGRGTFSTQVLQEFYVNVTRKIPSPLSRAEARRVVRQYWPLRSNGELSYARKPGFGPHRRLLPG